MKAAAIAIAFALMTATALHAQTDEKEKPAPEKPKYERIYVKPSVETTRTIYLNNISQPNDANEILTALRNMLDPSAKIYLVVSRNAIVVQTTPEMTALAEKLVKELDRPKQIYRLTYTLTQSDSGKRIGVQHFSMIVASGGRTTVKQGSKIPVITGTYTGGSSSQQQATYLDVGINIDASLDEFANGVRLKSKVEESSVAEERSSVGAQDPVIRQTVLEGTSILTPGKPQVIGSVDVAGSTRHAELEVVMEPVK